MAKITLEPRFLLKWLLGTLIVLIVLHVGGQYLWHEAHYFHWGSFTDRFDMDEETSVPTWFDITLLLMASAGMYCASLTEKSRGLAGFWKVLSGLFLLFSVDEAASFHEVLSTPIRYLLAIEGGGLYFAWVIPALLLITLFGLWAFRFWQALPLRTKYSLLLAGVFYLGGAVGIEMIEAQYFTTVGWDYGYTLLVAAEEILEKVGLIVLIYGLLNHLKLDTVQIAFKK